MRAPGYAFVVALLAACSSAEPESGERRAPAEGADDGPATLPAPPENTEEREALWRGYCQCAAYGDSFMDQVERQARCLAKTAWFECEARCFSDALLQATADCACGQACDPWEVVEAAPPSEAYLAFQRACEASCWGGSQGCVMPGFRDEAYLSMAECIETSPCVDLAQCVACE